MFFDALYQRHSSKTYFDFRINPRRECFEYCPFFDVSKPLFTQARSLQVVGVGECGC